jgi:hypothetical protein
MEFALQPADRVTMSIGDVGKLADVVAAGREPFGWLAEPVRRPADRTGR